VLTLRRGHPRITLLDFRNSIEAPLGFFVRPLLDAFVRQLARLIRRRPQDANFGVGTVEIDAAVAYKKNFLRKFKKSYYLIYSY
jgi:hypothetical protein